MNDLQVVVPYRASTGRPLVWVLEDLLESCGPSQVPILIVDNSDDSDLSQPGIPFLGPNADPARFPTNIEVVTRPENIGASAAWNLGLRRGADQTLIVSQWVRFSPAEFSRRQPSWGLDHVAAGIRDRASIYGLTFGDQGYHCISIGRATVTQVGEFDENLWFYGNDDDYVHRLDLAGIRGLLPDWGDWRDTGIWTMAFAAHKRGASTIDHDRSQRAVPYYYRKWCSTPDKHPGDYPTPFNDPTMTLRDWPPVDRNTVDYLTDTGQSSEKILIEKKRDLPNGSQALIQIVSEGQVIW